MAPCVSERVAIGNSAKVDAVISTHGDGAAAASMAFCLLNSMISGGLKAKSQSIAADIRNAIKASAVMPTANYEGTIGIDPVAAI
ncbi:MAG: hypothetical protein ABI137_08500 [Antricoccus sp.]